MPLPLEAASRPAIGSVKRLWWACAIGAPPIAFAAAAAGYGMATPRPLPDLAVIVLWSVAEEIVFRGAIQPALSRALSRRLRGPGLRFAITPANAVTSLVFAALHLWRHPPIVALAVFPVSLVYGRARELSGRVWPAALLHVCFNVLLYAASWFLAGAR